jgi:hypothetical protein
MTDLITRIEQLAGPAVAKAIKTEFGGSAAYIPLLLVDLGKAMPVFANAIDRRIDSSPEFKQGAMAGARAACEDKFDERRSSNPYAPCTTQREAWEIGYFTGQRMYWNYRMGREVI